MIGDIRTVEIEGKSYDVKKMGASTALEIQSIFTELIIRSGIAVDGSDVPDEQLGIDLIVGMRGRIINDVKKIIIECTDAPKFTNETYESLDYKVIPLLFMQVYYWNVGDSEKKSD